MSSMTPLPAKPLPSKEELLSYRGMTLLHFKLSNCSQRVRICLFEKELPWRSLHIDMMRNQHATDWYQSIHPKGVVPALIHDGSVITESINIIQYLNSLRAEPALFPSEGKQRARMEQLLRGADDIQGIVKLLSHVFLFHVQRPLAKLTFKRFAQNHQNRDLVEFRRRFIHGEFTREEINRALVEARAHLNVLDDCVSQSAGNGAWLLGEQFSLADIAWVVNVHRFDLMGLPVQQFPALYQWYQRALARPSVQQGLVDFEPKPLLRLLQLTRALRAPDHRAFTSAA